MVTIHIAGDGHNTPLGRHTWNAYTDNKKKKVIEDALFILKNNVKGMKPCNDCFQKLSGGRTFDNLLDDNTIFISHDPHNNQGDFGATIGNDITITDFSIAMGRWTVAATLVHELAHVNGAPGNDHQAEGTLPCCGFAALEDKTIIGVSEIPQGDTRIA